MAIHPETIKDVRNLINGEHRPHPTVYSTVEVLLGDAERTEHARQRALSPDAKGRTPEDRIAAIERGGDPITHRQRGLATALLVEMLTAAQLHGVTLDHLDWVGDLPGTCVDVVLHRS